MPIPQPEVLPFNDHNMISGKKRGREERLAEDFNAENKSLRNGCCKECMKAFSKNKKS
jgi:hypothetical protein